MSTRKILSAVLASTLVGSSLLPGVTNAAIDFWGPQSITRVSDSSYTSSQKIQKFIGAEDRVLAYMNRDYKKTVINLKNANAKQAYEEEYLDILNNIKDVFASAQYSYDSELPIYMANLKKEINTYKTLRKELVSMKGITSNPFTIPAQETASVESDIIDFQKILTEVMGKALDKYDSSDFKEMGKENISAEGSFGKIDISIEKYTSILSLLTRSQEADMTAKATFTLNLPGSYEYNETTDDYEQTPGKTVSGDLSIDGSMKMIDRDMYLTLRDYSFNIDLPETERVSIDEFLKNLAQYKGKTVKISIPSSESTTKLSSAEMLSQLKKVLMVLDTNSLFTPYKKIGDTYTLTLKESTIESISTIYDQKMPSADIVQVKKEMRKMPLLYTTASGKSTLFVRINENNANGMASLSKQDGEYSFLLDTKNPKNSSESMHLLIKKDLVEGKIQSSGINISIDYKNRTLSLTGEGYMQTVKIEWPLSPEHTDLVFTFNGKKVGNVTWKKVAETYTYDVLFEMTTVEMLSKFHVNGESTTSKGTFPIVAPKDFIEKKITQAFPDGDYWDKTPVYETPITEEDSEVVEDTSVSPTKILTQEEISAIKKTAYIEGNKDATITLVEYSDLECPFCIRQHNDGTIKKIHEKYGDRVNSIFKNFRAVPHENSESEANALLCAGEVGGTDKYVRYYNAILTYSKGGGSWFSKDILLPLAKKLKIDEQKFQTCIDSQKNIARFDQETAEGTKLGVQGTPGTVIINNKTGEYELIAGAYPVDEFEKVINKLLGTK